MGNDQDVSGVLKGARVLVVEDDFFISLELVSVFTDAGARVVGPCHTVEDALASAKANEITAALLDFRLGNDTSIAVAHELQRRNVPFAFYTGQAATDLIWSEWPHCRIIAKPSRPDILVKIVAELLDISPAQ
jgi:DNA-binding NtrC family response regulator